MQDFMTAWYRAGSFVCQQIPAPPTPRWDFFQAGDVPELVMLAVSLCRAHISALNPPCWLKITQVNKLQQF